MIGVLDELGIRKVTDKSSLDHAYLDYYERLFAPFRDQSITVFEIGVFDGGSLHVWEDYFPRATIVGVDIRPECARFAGGRRIVEIASQADETAMRRLGELYRPSIIIDDGSHMADHIMSSFEFLFPLLAPGGVYIVEDLAMHSGPGALRKRGNALESPQSYFLRLANWVMCPGDVSIDLNKFGQIHMVEFKYCIAAIKKKGLLDQRRIEERRAIVDEVQSASNYFWFSNYVINNGGDIDMAIDYARKATVEQPNAGIHHLRLSAVLERAGRLQEALVAAEEGIRLDPQWRDVADRIRAKING